MGILERAKLQEADEQQEGKSSLRDDAVMSTVMIKASLEDAVAEPKEALRLEESPKNDSASEVNIWDIADNETEADPVSRKPKQTSEVLETPTSLRPRRKARNKTRILGFTPQDTSVNSLLSDNGGADTAVVKNIVSMNPTGWLVIVSGAGRGACFPLFSGMASIGRSADQMISLDFGDTAISRENHASIAYDPTEHIFYFGHGGKSNLVRMNGKPVLSTEVAKDGDEFLIGETTLRLKTFCGPDFNWESNTERDDHVAIA